MVAKAFPDKALEPIAVNRFFEMLFAYHQTEPCRLNWCLV